MPDKIKPKKRFGDKRFQDSNEKLVTYRQKFVEILSEVEPNAFEDLRKIGPSFRILFGNRPKNDCLKTLADVLINLLPHRLPGNWGRSFNLEYVWGEIRSKLLISQERFLASQLDYAKTESGELRKFLEHKSYTLDRFNELIVQSFNKDNYPAEAILVSFFLMLGSIYLWVEKYSLHKDWLVRYAFDLISQFSRDDQLAVKDLKIEAQTYVRLTIYKEFDFRTSGWMASQEGPDDYKMRVTNEFKQRLDQYLTDAGTDIKTNNLRGVGKTPTYENVRWLVYSTVKGWDTERIVEKFFPDIAANRSMSMGCYYTFDNKVTHINGEIRPLAKYGLPVRIAVK